MTAYSYTYSSHRAKVFTKNILVYSNWCLWRFPLWSCTHSARVEVLHDTSGLVMRVRTDAICPQNGFEASLITAVTAGAVHSCVRQLVPSWFINVVVTQHCAHLSLTWDGDQAILVSLHHQIIIRILNRGVMPMTSHFGWNNSNTLLGCCVLC